MPLMTDAIASALNRSLTTSRVLCVHSHLEVDIPSGHRALLQVDIVQDNVLCIYIAII